MPIEVVNGVQLRYEVVGSGEPLVLVHGSWGDHHNWDLLVPLLVDRFQVVAYDRRGHSDSDCIRRHHPAGAALHRRPVPSSGRRISSRVPDHA